MKKGEKTNFHGMSKTSEYLAWRHLRDRCLNPKNKLWPYYGGRGIKVCEEWSGSDGFKKFIEHIGLKTTIKHSLDRIDNDGNYEPGNVRWSTTKEQSINKRKKLNKKSLRGTSFDLKNNKWRSTIQINGKTIHLGRYKSEHEAHEKFLEKYYNHYKKFPPEYKPVEVIYERG